MVAVDFGPQHIVRRLEVEPKTRIDAKERAQANSRVGAHVATRAPGFDYAVARNADGLPQSAGAPPERLQAFYGERFAGMRAQIVSQRVV